MWIQRHPEKGGIDLHEEDKLFLGKDSKAKAEIEIWGGSNKQDLGKKCPKKILRKIFLHDIIFLSSTALIKDILQGFCN